MVFKAITFNKAQVKRLYPRAQDALYYPHLLHHMTTRFHIVLLLESDNVVHSRVQLKGKSPSIDFSLEFY